MEKKDKGKNLSEALAWEPTFGERERPQYLWDIIMEEYDGRTSYEIPAFGQVGYRDTQ